MKPIGDFIKSTLEFLTQQPEQRKACPDCGTPYKLFGSKIRDETVLTWQAALSESLSANAPQFVQILELLEFKTDSITLEPDVTAYAENTVIYTNHDNLKPNDLATITARVTLPRVVQAFPEDRCCATRALKLGERLQSVKGNSEESQRVRSNGGFLVAWGREQERIAREQEILEQYPLEQQMQGAAA